MVAVSAAWIRVWKGLARAKLQDWHGRKRVEVKFWDPQLYQLDTVMKRRGRWAWTWLRWMVVWVLYGQ